MAADDLPERGPQLERVIARAIEAALSTDFFKVRIARVVKWDAAHQRADCQPLVKRVYQGESGERLVASRKVVPSCLVAVLGAGGYRSTFPISDGSDGSAQTTGLLLYSDDSIDRWAIGDGGEVDPEIDHAHAPMDGIFICGVLPFGRAWASYPTDHATIGADSGTQLHLRANKVVVAANESGSKAVGLDGDEVTCSKIEILGGIGNAFTGLKITDPDGTPHTINATGMQVTIKGNLEASAAELEAK